MIKGVMNCEIKCIIKIFCIFQNSKLLSSQNTLVQKQLLLNYSFRVLSHYDIIVQRKKIDAHFCIIASLAPPTDALKCQVEETQSLHRLPCDPNIRKAWMNFLFKQGSRLCQSDTLHLYASFYCRFIFKQDTVCRRLFRESENKSY